MPALIVYFALLGLFLCVAAMATRNTKNNYSNKSDDTPVIYSGTHDYLNDGRY